MKKVRRTKNGKMTNEFKAELVEILWELKYNISKKSTISLNGFFRDHKLGTSYAVAIRAVGVIKKISNGRYRWTSENSPNPEMAMMIYDKMHSIGKIHNQKANMNKQRELDFNRPRKEIKKVPAIKSTIENYKSTPKKEKFTEKEIIFLWGAFKYKRK